MDVNIDGEDLEEIIDFKLINNKTDAAAIRGTNCNIFLRKEITFTSLNYHRPPTDSCGLSKLDRSKFYIDCQLLDGVKASLRGQEIWINYLSECNIQKLNS